MTLDTTVQRYSRKKRRPTLASPSVPFINGFPVEPNEGAFVPSRTIFSPKGIIGIIEPTPTSYIVLGLVEQLGEASPYDLKQAVVRSIGNFWSVPHSQIYREADRLERSGHVKCRREKTPGGRPRKNYRLSERGRRELSRWKDEPPQELPELRDLGLLKLFFGADPRRLAETRREAHRRKLEEYEARKQADPDGEPAGPWLSLDAGIGHEREWVRFWSAIARGRRP